MVVAVKVGKDNKVDITLDELNKMLDKAYKEGVEEGRQLVLESKPQKAMCGDTPIVLCGKLNTTGGTFPKDISVTY